MRISQTKIVLCKVKTQKYQEMYKQVNYQITKKLLKFKIDQLLKLNLLQIKICDIEIQIETQFKAEEHHKVSHHRKCG